MVVDASRLAADTLRLLPRKRLSRFLGSAAAWSSPPQWALDAMIAAFVRVYGVDLSEAVLPAEGFSSFDEFFTRRLRPGVRPIARNAAVVSPADGRVEDLGRIDPEGSLRIKGRSYRVADLLGSGDQVEYFAGGFFAVVYLSPCDYHRVHAPVDGGVRLIRHVPGTLFPVNRIGLEHIGGLFARNERVAIVQTNETYGDIVTTMVGAMGVGKITLSFDESVVTNSGGQAVCRAYPSPRPNLTAGEELGIFHLGSTVIVFAPSHDDLRLVPRAGDTVRMGEALIGMA